jgi:hypothetical protein
VAKFTRHDFGAILTFRSGNHGWNRASRGTASCPAWKAHHDGEPSTKFSPYLLDLPASDELIAIGGRDELLEAQRLGKKITFNPADMNHAAAIKKGVDVRGSVHKAMQKRRSP